MTEEIKEESLADYVTRLKQENESFKKTEKTYQDSIHKLLQVQYGLADSCKKYSTVLEEIREITKKI